MTKSTTIGAVIWPDARTQRSVNSIRTRYDPHFELIAPHITIIFPANTPRDIEDVSLCLTKAIEGFRPFHVRLNRLSSINLLAPDWPAGTSALLAYPNAVNTIFLLAGEGSREILELKERINIPLGLDTPLIHYPPYLTLGQTLSAAVYETALEDLAGYTPDYCFPVDGFDLLEEVPVGKWRTARRFEFSPSRSGDHGKDGKN